MKTIYKYKLNVGLNKLKIPYIQILSVIKQDFNTVLYALIDDEKQEKELQVLVTGTGLELEDNVVDSKFLGTVKDGMFVWHVFYKE